MLARPGELEEIHEGEEERNGRESHHDPMGVKKAWSHDSDQLELRAALMKHSK